ncbi:MAG TPA: hypothetical protein VF335_05040, partial [Chitinivibrionales bacterium]
YFASKLTFAYGLHAQGLISKPISRNFVVDGSLTLAGMMITQSDSVYSTSSDKSFYAETYPNARLETSASCKWYPSLRSTISLTATYMVSKDFDYTSQTNRGDISTASIFSRQGKLTAQEFSTSLNVSYFISPRCSYSIWSSLHSSRGENRSNFGSYYYFNDRWNVRSLTFYFGSSVSAAIF